MATNSKRALLVSNGWVQAVIIVLLFGFFVLGFLAYRTYTGEPPVPGRVTDAGGHVLFTRADILDILDGQEIFLRNGLMEYGSIFGHGSYLGPDFTADYLHRSALVAHNFYRQMGSDRAQALTVSDFKTNRYDSASDTLTLTPTQVAAFNQLCGHYQAYFGQKSSQYGLRPEAISDPGQIALLSGIGILLFAFGRWEFLGWYGAEQRTVSFKPPSSVTLTPAQRACALFFLVMALLFLAQTLLGGASQHYRADITSFFGIHLLAQP